MNSIFQKKVHLNFCRLGAKEAFVQENINRIQEEIKQFEEELEELKLNQGNAVEEIQAKKKKFQICRERLKSQKIC